MTPPHASIDFESYSEADLPDCGADAYARHPSTEVLCMAWCIGDGEPEVWIPGQPFPAALAAHILAGGILKAWNAPFERAIWRHVCVPRMGWPAVGDEQWFCSAAEGANMALPRDLDGAAQALGNAALKDLNGKRVMMQLSKPRKPTKTDPRTRWTPEMAPEKFATLYAYCRQDVLAERGIAKRVYALSPAEREVYLLDQRINDRGVRIDRALIEAAQHVVGATLADLDRQLAEATGGFVTSATQTGRLREWLNANGLPHIDSVAAHIIEDSLKIRGLPWETEKVLLIRKEAGKSSTAKLEAMLAAAGPDDRIRGSLLYYGASRTGRWSGRLHQPQNFPRGDEAVLNEIDLAVRLLMARDVRSIRLLLGNPLDVVASCLRACMLAAPGHDLMACDFANIEGRVLAWMAGETWKLNAFRAYDAGTGPDLYKVAYGKSFGVRPEDVTKPQRQIGKVQELACGYQGWVGAFQTFAKLYRVVVPDDKAAEMAGAWREAHPNVVRLWRDLNDAAFRAVANPGRRFEAGPVTYLCANDYLWCRLPSGRVLAYCRPSIEKNDRGEDAVHYWGVPNATKPIPPGPGNSRRWAKLSAYGGLFCENIDQAISRDLLVAAMLRLEAAGYPLVLTVHDELVAEVPRDGAQPYSVADMEHIAAELPRWAAGLPVAAEGWRGERYRK